MKKKLLLDIGCGDILTERDGFISIGIDINVHDNPDVKVIDMIRQPEDALEWLGEESVDLIICNDFLEHIPTYIAYGDYPRIKLFNTIWKLLKWGGEFESYTPYLSSHCKSTAWAQDPTHVGMPYTKTSFEYFSNNPAYVRLQRLYGIESRFVIESMNPSKGKTHLFVLMSKHE